MKKLLTVLALVLVVAASVVGGTLAVYNVKITGVVDNTVTAKEFVLTAETEEQYEQNILIAPTDSKAYVFTVSNTQGAIVTGTDMNVTISVKIANADGKQSIAPLKISLLKMVGSEWVAACENNVVNGDENATMTATDSFVANVSATYRYKLVVEWPSTNNDTAYAGAEFGNKFAIDVEGVQA